MTNFEKKRDRREKQRMLNKWKTTINHTSYVKFLSSIPPRDTLLDKILMQDYLRDSILSNI
jgi:hypothetical protein